MLCLLIVSTYLHKYGILYTITTDIGTVYFTYLSTIVLSETALERRMKWIKTIPFSISGCALDKAKTCLISWVITVLDGIFYNVRNSGLRKKQSIECK
jgi:hypothetical protein